MTIKEIEEKTGMTRANIRYYEREGLLSPSRSDNNYRDYSEGDLAALQKIRLLRQLHVPVGEIVRLQKGETSLDTVLEAQSASLRGEIDELAAAAALCQELRESRVGYDELDAERYLNRVIAEEEEPRRWEPLRCDVLPVAPHPWKRFFARALDMAVVGLAIDVLWMLVWRMPLESESNLIVDWLAGLAVFAVEAFVEAILLCTVGATPGKWIFGLKVRSVNGEKLSFWEGFQRAGAILVFGQGGGIFPLSIWRYWKSYCACKNSEVMPWDEGIAYACEERRLCGLYYGAAQAAYWALTALAVVQTFIPVHRGALTKQAFFENCEVYAGQHLESIYGDQFLDDDGHWQADPEAWAIRWNLDDYAESPYELTINDKGMVTAVRIEYEISGADGFITPPDVPVQILRQGYAMASNRVNAATYWKHMSAWAERDWMENFTFVDGNVRVTNTAEMRGYDKIGDVYLAKAWEETYFHWSFTLELIET